MRDRFNRDRKTLPPPAPPDLTHATRLYDPIYDSPAAEGRQQLIISALQLVNTYKIYRPPPSMPTTGILAGKRLLIKAQALENGMNAKRLVASHIVWPCRGEGAETGSQNLTALDKLLERVVGRIPRPGTFELSRLIGINFVATVWRSRRRLGDGTWHPTAIFRITDPDCCRLYDDWPAYPPLYTHYESSRIFKPPELGDVKI